MVIHKKYYPCLTTSTAQFNGKLNDYRHLYTSCLRKNEEDIHTVYAQRTPYVLTIACSGCSLIAVKGDDTPPDTQLPAPAALSRAGITTGMGAASRGGWERKKSIISCNGKLTNMRDENTYAARGVRQIYTEDDAEYAADTLAREELRGIEDSSMRDFHDWDYVIGAEWDE